MVTLHLRKQVVEEEYSWKPMQTVCAICVSLDRVVEENEMSLKPIHCQTGKADCTKQNPNDPEMGHWVYIIF